MKKYSHKNSALALAALSVLVAAIWVAVWSGGSTSAENHSEGSRYSFAWTEGQSYRYTLAFRASESFRPAAEASSSRISGESSAYGELVLRSYGRSGDNYLLGFELQGCTEASITVAGHSVVSSADDCKELLEGYELFAEVAPTGEIKSLYDMESTEETRLASHFLHGLVTELQVVVGTGPAWTAMQTSTRGRALNHYEHTTSALILTRERTSYEKLQTLPTSESANTEVAAIATINLASDGYLKSFNGSESIVVEENGVTVAESASELQVEFIGMMPAARKAPVLANASKRAVGELSSPARMRTLLLEQRAGAMTQKKLLDMMARYGDGGTMPNHAQFMWSVTGFLELHPEACVPFSELFGVANTSPKRRALITDVLAQVRHPEAQRALVAILSTPAAMGDPRFIRYFQSLAVTPSPTAESIAFASSQLARGENSEATSDQFAATAAAFVLGGMRNHVAESNPEAAKVIDASLVDFVENAEDAEDDMALSNALRALGNTRAEHHTDVYAEYQDHKSPTVRRSAASALGRTGSARSTAVLLDMAKDENARVQGSALDALQTLSIAAEDLIAMGDFVAAGKMHWHNHGPFVSLIENNLNNLPGAVQLALEAVLAAPNLQSPDSRAAAYRLLERLAR